MSEVGYLPEQMDISMSMNTNKDKDCDNTAEKIVATNGAKQEDPAGYKNNCKAHQVGISHDKMVQVYSDWAKNYDVELKGGLYRGPEIVAEVMAKYYPTDKRPNVKILDVAAGTGKIGVELAKFGFKIMDALEPSKGMLEVLVGRNLYQRTYEDAVGYKPVAEILADSYDAMALAGGMGEGHIPVGAITEFIRILRPGGLIFIVMRQEYLHIVDDYRRKLEPLMESLVKQGLWMRIERTDVPNYLFNKNGVVFVYQKNRIMCALPK